MVGVCPAIAKATTWLDNSEVIISYPHFLFNEYSRMYSACSGEPES